MLISRRFAVIATMLALPCTALAQQRRPPVSSSQTTGGNVFPEQPPASRPDQLGQSTTKLPIGIVMTSDFLPLYAAIDRGVFQKSNLDVSIVRMPNLTSIPTALMSGRFPIGAATMLTLLQSIDGGADLVLVAGATRQVRKSTRISLVVRNDLKTERASDLRGKTIGVSVFNGTMDIFFRKWLMIKGINPKDVTIVEVVSPKIIDLLREGRIDAVATTEPVRTTLLNDKVGYILADFFSDVADDVIMLGYVATRTWASKNVDIIRAFRRSLSESHQWVSDNFQDAQQIEANLLNSKSPNPPQATVVVRQEDLQIYIDIGKELGLFRTKLEASKILLED